MADTGSHGDLAAAPKDMNTVTYVRVNVGPSSRLGTAQRRLERSIASFGLRPLPVLGGRRLSLLGPVLAHARRHCRGEGFVWCNSDVVLTRNPYEIPDPNKVYGFFRREVPSGEFISGVDMYYVPVKWWDDYLSKDIPKLFVGASYVDWWISRAMEKAGAYGNLAGYIDHVSHPRSDAATSDASPFYQHNFRAYNAWAKRHGLDPIAAPRYLIPKLGHVWGVRDAVRRLRHRFVRTNCV